MPTPSYASIGDFFIQYDIAEERPLLHTPVGNVSIRLYNSNNFYWTMIDHVIRYMLFALEQTFQDHLEVTKGISAVKLGIPLNIVAYRVNGSVEVMLNPKIVAKSPASSKGRTNCASMQLKEPVEVERYTWVDVSYYDRAGKCRLLKNITGVQGGWVLQHELCHSAGILPINSVPVPEVTKPKRVMRLAATPVTASEVPPIQRFPQVNPTPDDSAASAIIAARTQLSVVGGDCSVHPQELPEWRHHTPPG